MQPGVVKIDVHGRNKYQARILIDSNLRRADKSVYRLLIIHGYHSGTELKDMIREEYPKHPRVLRIAPSLNPGETELVLREY